MMLKIPEILAPTGVAAIIIDSGTILSSLIIFLPLNVWQRVFAKISFIFGSIEYNFLQFHHLFSMVVYISFHMLYFSRSIAAKKHQTFLDF